MNGKVRENDVVVIKYAQKYFFKNRCSGGAKGTWEQHDLEAYYGEIGLVQHHPGGIPFLKMKHNEVPESFKTGKNKTFICDFALHWFDFDKIGVL